MKHFTYEGKAKLILPAERAALEKLRDWVEGIADSLCTPLRAKHQILIAVDEIFTNIASYSYEGKPGFAGVSVDFDEEARELILTFEDEGVAYNPLEAREPDIEAALEEREIGGLGILMVRQLMDSVEYKREGNRNILILKKGTA